MAVQLSSMAILIEAAHVHYLAATVISVEAAILHNFTWHQRWTWRDRPSATPAGALTRLARFHLLNGVVSLAGNAILVGLLTGGAGMHPVASSAIAIGACSIVNFLASEVLVFRAAT